MRAEGLRDQEPIASLDFTWRTSGDDAVRILRHGKKVTILRGKVAAQFLAKAEGASEEATQLLCAKVTGNYKRGNERRISRKDR